MDVENSNKESDLTNLLEEIDRAFGTIVPSQDLRNCATMEDFARTYGERFLPEYWELIYHLDESATRYVFPFVMRYFATNLNSGADDDVQLDLLVGILDPSSQQVYGLVSSYNFTSNYSIEQRRVVCKWLRFLQRHQTLPSGRLEEAAAAWC